MKSFFSAIVVVLTFITSANASLSFPSYPFAYTETDTPTEYEPTEYEPTEYEPTEYEPTEYEPTEYEPTEYTQVEYAPRKHTRYSLRKHKRHGPKKRTYKRAKPTRYYVPAKPIRYKPGKPYKYAPSKPTRYTPAKPTRYAPAKRASYAPAKPTRYAPTKSTRYKPAKQSSYAPAKPISYEPKEPINYAPTKPTNYAPIKPVKTPAKPVNYAPEITKPVKTPAKPVNYAPEMPTVSTNGLEAQFLAPQNAARAAVGLSPLVWDSTLATYAQWWANERRYDCALEHSNGKYGENIFWGGGSGFTATQAASEWVAERSHYNYGDNSCSGEMCGHYTQIVWEKTTKVGCAKTECYYGLGVFMVCSYDPAGNYVGQKPY